MPKLKDHLQTALAETLRMQHAPVEDWNKEGTPFGPGIPAPGGAGSYPTSRAAMDALATIADGLLDNDSDLSRTVSQDSARREAATVFGDMLSGFTGDIDDDWKAFRDRLLTDLKAGRGRLTHYLPVWLFTGQDAVAFDVGPVRFLPRSDWLPAIEARRGARSSWMAGVEEVWSRKSPIGPDTPWPVKSVAGPVHPDQWVACVTVDGFECDESRRRAVVAIRSAVDTVRVLVGAPGNARLRTVLDHGPPLGVKRMSQRDNEDLAMGSAVNMPGLSGAPGMAAGLIADGAAVLAAAGRSIGVFVAPSRQAGKDCPKLSDRWINALHWYGLACAEEADFAALVDFAISLDILSGGKEEAGILELTARLLQIPVDRQVSTDLPFKKLVEMVYKYRSHIAHGSILALDETLRTERMLAEWLARQALIGYALDLEKHAAAGGADDRDSFRDGLPGIPAGP